MRGGDFTFMTFRMELPGYTLHAKWSQDFPAPIFDKIGSMRSIVSAIEKVAPALIRRMKNVARAVFRIPDPFRDITRDGTSVRLPYHSQYGQDRIFHEELFGARRAGVFVDVGAHDGVSFSNTLFFERNLAWRGLCIEPIPEIFDSLARNRNAICVNACVARKTGSKKFLRVRGYAEMLSGMLDAYDPRHVVRIRDEVREAGGSMEEIDVQGIRLDELFRSQGLDSIDLLCIDVEGAEIEALASFDLGSIRPSVVCIENNYLDPRIWRALRRAKYRPYARIRQDEIYLSQGFEPVRSA
jgi:FkbM family methyltransferase